MFCPVSDINGRLISVRPTTNNSPMVCSTLAKGCRRFCRQAKNRLQCEFFPPLLSSHKGNKIMMTKYIKTLKYFYCHLISIFHTKTFKVSLNFATGSSSLTHLTPRVWLSACLWISFYKRVKFLFAKFILFYVCFFHIVSSCLNNLLTQKLHEK